MHAYNTAIYDLLERWDNEETEEEEWDQDVDKDDWSSFPECKDPTGYALVSYCPMTGKEIF